MPTARLMPLTLPTLDPASLLTALPPGPGRFLLESGPAGPHEVRRFSFVGAEPFCTLLTHGRQAQIHEEGRTRTAEADPFSLLQTLLTEYRVTAPLGFPPAFAGGAVGYLGYDLGRNVEHLGESAIDDLGLPQMLLGFYDVILAIDHTLHAAFLIIAPPEGREAAAGQKARRWAFALKEAAPLPPLSLAPVAGPVRSSFTRQQYLAAVRRSLDYIAAGDIYQVNLAQRFACPYAGTGWDLYRRLRARNPAPFGAFLDAGAWQVISASPERFITVRDRQIETRPIKGTRPRSSEPNQDQAYAAELLASEKEAAELLMIVDLQRNDLGRICEFGSVQVPDLRRLEATPNVWHTVATVQGRLREGILLADILRATFPGGSITGAPKVRAMQIIEELEPVRRGIYTGAIGYIGFDGSIDLNIAIRTALLREGTAYFHAGGGLVADSVPEAEYAETLSKASGIGKALEVNFHDLP